MYNINDIFELDEEYSARAEWANNNHAMIVELEPVDGVRKFQLLSIPEPTKEDKAATARQIRDNYLQIYVDPIVSNPLRWANMSDEEQSNIKAYRQYLLDIPQSENFPNVEIMTFDEWLNNKTDNS